MAGVSIWATGAPSVLTSSIDVSLPLSRTKAMRLPSGDQRGRASTPLPVVTRRATPLRRSSNQIHP